MRLFTSVLASVAILIAASASSALTFSATASSASGNALNALVVGDVVTVNIRMSNPAAVAIFGIGGGVQGWDNSVAQFVSGAMNAGPYFCTTTACTAGLNNGLPFASDADGNFIADGTAVQNVAGVGNYVPIVQAIATQGRAGNGARDPGLDFVVNGGDAQVRLVFNAVANGPTSIVIGTDPNPIIGNVIVLAAGNTVQATNAVINIDVPEPGMAGAGLAAMGSAVALAGIRRRIAA